MPASAAIPRVMVVDDEPMVRRFVSTILSRSGYDVVDAASPEQAALIMEGDRDFDLLVTDVVISRLSASQPGLRVLFMSDYEEGACTADVPRSSFLQKPFRVPELLERVREILA
jgi:DNA-binding response OmpR family regulator